MQDCTKRFLNIIMHTLPEVESPLLAKVLVSKACLHTANRIKIALNTLCTKAIGVAKPGLRYESCYRVL